MLEPLNRREAHFCRLVADASAIARDVGHPAACVMGDFWHMTWEETSDRAAFIAAGDYLHHVLPAEGSAICPEKMRRQTIILMDSKG